MCLQVTVRYISTYIVNKIFISLYKNTYVLNELKFKVLISPNKMFWLKILTSWIKLIKLTFGMRGTYVLNKST